MASGSIVVSHGPYDDLRVLPTIALLSRVIRSFQVIDSKKFASMTSTTCLGPSRESWAQLRHSREKLKGSPRGKPLICWLQGKDLNLRPSGYEADLSVNKYVVFLVETLDANGATEANNTSYFLLYDNPPNEFGKLLAKTNSRTSWPNTSFCTQIQFPG